MYFQRICWIALFLSGLFLLISIRPLFSAQDATVVLGRCVIKKDTTWRGKVLITGDVEVAKGAILTISPGTIIQFSKISQWGEEKLYSDKTDHFPRAELVIRGRVIAQGTKDNWIHFRSAQKNPHPADWGAVNLLDSRDNIFEFCEFSYGHTAIHCHGGQVVISSCYFHDNGVAIGLKNVPHYKTRCVVTILYNRIIANGGGILFGNGTSPTIVHNLIKDNKIFGVFAKKAGPATIRFNNFLGNGKALALYSTSRIIFTYNNVTESIDYHVSLFEGQNEDVSAPYNWWGTKDIQAIEKMVWDRQKEKDLGRLIFTPIAKVPVVGAGLP